MPWLPQQSGQKNWASNTTHVKGISLMSLFENPEYQWRETFLVLFDEQQRPTAEQVEAAFTQIGKQFEQHNVRRTESGLLEAVTMISQTDYAGLDISYIDGEDVSDQIEELLTMIDIDDLMPGEDELVARIPLCNARFDILHFENIAGAIGEEEMDFMDPGAMLIVAQKLASVVDGIAVDPNSGTFI